MSLWSLPEGEGAVNLRNGTCGQRTQAPRQRRIGRRIDVKRQQKALYNSLEVRSEAVS